MTQVYSNPKRANDTFSLPDVEVFHADSGDLWKAGESCDGWTPDDDNEAGFYYWYCMPGCMPDSSPNGPYATEDEAIEAALEDAAEFGDDDDDEG